MEKCAYCEQDTAGNHQAGCPNQGFIFTLNSEILPHCEKCGNFHSVGMDCVALTCAADFAEPLTPFQISYMPPPDGFILVPKEALEVLKAASVPHSCYVEGCPLTKARKELTEALKDI